MKLTILGSGCPSVALDRHGPSALIDCGEGARILIDCGSGVTQRLLEHGLPGSEIDALLLVTAQLLIPPSSPNPKYASAFSFSSFA